MKKESLLGKTLQELYEVVESVELPQFAARQIAAWLYKRDVSSIDDMSDISKRGRERLKNRYSFGLTSPTQVQSSIDGTKKYLFTTNSGKFIETAMIPDAERKTVCVSSQIGCKMGCRFCMTGEQGFQGQLSPGEIINQVKSIDEHSEITNIVYMGMGEPFDNLDNVMKSLEILTSSYGFALSPKRITVSSIGVNPGIKEFLRSSSCHLAISLHTPFEEERKRLVPGQAAYPIKEVIDLLREHSFGRQRRVSFEYIMFEGFNDTHKHAMELVRMLRGIRCRVNLIRFHPTPGFPMKSSDNSAIFRFKDLISSKGITTTIRTSRGKDISAACGLLSTKGRT